MAFCRLIHSPLANFPIKRERERENESNVALMGEVKQTFITSIHKSAEKMLMEK